ncbi:hypothetical protein ACFQX6_28950 [Streptosporangium lutulentum]
MSPRRLASAADSGDAFLKFLEPGDFLAELLQKPVEFFVAAPAKRFHG